MANNTAGRAISRNQVDLMKENLLLKTEILELKNLVEFYRSQVVDDERDFLAIASQTQTECRCECTCGQFQSAADMDGHLNDYVYVPEVKMYYSESSGYYYNPTTSLFYNANLQRYYHYDACTGQYTEYSYTNHCFSREDDGGSSSLVSAESLLAKHELPKTDSVSLDTGQTILDLIDQVDQVLSLKEDILESTSDNNEEASLPSDARISNVLSTTSDSNLCPGGRKRTFDYVPQPLPYAALNVEQEEDYFSEKEEGELTESDGEWAAAEDYTEFAQIKAGEFQENNQHQREDIASSFPCCIRAVVLESDFLQVHSLHIITINGAVVGSDSSCDIPVSSKSISKKHCSIGYDEEDYYFVEDLGSLFGTYISDQKLQPGQRYRVNHLDTLRAGASSFALHIHRGDNTCKGCEPGLLAVASGDISTDSKDASHVPTDVQRRQQVNKMKKRYGIKSSGYEDDKSIASLGKKYKDRAKGRRAVKGSDNPYQADDAPSSVHRELSSENKGFKMLSKMGWKHGGSIGKSEKGIIEPIAQVGHFGTAGLGSDVAVKADAGDVVSLEKRRRLAKTRLRYEKKL